MEASATAKVDVEAKDIVSDLSRISQFKGARASAASEAKFAKKVAVSPPSNVSTPPNVGVGVTAKETAAATAEKSNAPSIGAQICAKAIAEEKAYWGPDVKGSSSLGSNSLSRNKSDP